MFNKINGYFEESNGNKYLTLVPASENKEKIKFFGKLWIKIRYLIRAVTKKWDGYDEKCIKIKFDSDDKLPLNKAIEIPVIVKNVRAVLYQNNKYFSLFVFLKL